MKWIYAIASYLLAFDLGIYATRLRNGENIDPHKIVITVLIFLVTAYGYYSEIKQQKP